MTWWRRLLQRRALERELDAELRDHIEREVADGVRSGYAEADVRREMRLRSGGLDQIKEACRDLRQPRLLADLGADVRFAWRILARDRWFTAGAILTLALAMSAANTTFISTYANLWRDLPADRPERIAIVRTVDGRSREGGVSYLDFEALQQNSRVFDGMAAAFSPATITLGRDGAAPEQFDGLYVSHDTFSVLRVAPLAGRDFSAADDRPGAAPVVIIGSNVWKNRYGGSPDVVGRQVVVNAVTPATIIGVMPDRFRFVDFTDVWLPLSQMPAATRQRRDARGLMMIGRLPDGVGLSRVRADLAPIAANLAAAYPETNKDIRPLVNSLQEAYDGGMGWTDTLTLMPLLAAVFILLIASANMANLLMARAAHRSREIAIRVGVGATRWRIVRQLLIESLLLALVAWVLAVTFSWVSLNLTTAHGDPQLPYWRLKMDVRLLGMLAAVALFVTGLFGLAPALFVSRRGTAEGLKEGGRLSATPKTRRWTHALLVGQFAVTLALLNGAGLTAKTFYKLYGLDLNVQTSDAITTSVRLPPQRYATPAQRTAFHEQLKGRLMAVPGITSTTVASAAPFTGAGRRRLIAVDGQPRESPPDVLTVIVEPTYFQTVVRGLVLGDPFSETDGTPGHESAIVNQRFAAVYLGVGSPIGRGLDLRVPTAQRAFSSEQEAPTPPFHVTIVGVSPDIRQGPGDAVPTIYLPFRAEAPAGATLIVRGTGGPARVVSAARAAANAIDPDIALGTVRTLDDLRDRSRSLSAGMASQFTKIGGLALILSGVGLYSAIAYAARRRTQEIAIRMALGAQDRDVRWLFLKTGAWVAVGGLVLGVPASLAVGRLLQNNAVRTDGFDATMLTTMGVLLATVALAASIVPAWRATRVEPTTALRIE